MQSSRGLFRLHRSKAWAEGSLASQCRQASLTSAIERGIRKGKRGTETAEKRWSEKPFEVAHQPERNPGGYRGRAPTHTELDMPPRSDSFRKDRRDPNIYTNSNSSPLPTGSRSGENYEGNRRSRRPDNGGSWSGYRKSVDQDFGPDVDLSDTTRRGTRRGSRETGANRHREYKPRDYGSGVERTSRYLPPTGDDAQSANSTSSAYFSRRRSDYEREEGPIFPRKEKDFRQDSRDTAKDEGYRERERYDRQSYGKGRPSVHAPLAIPYTTAGSEFLYGTFAVKAAIQSGRRKLYKLYIYEGGEADGHTPRDESIRKLALARSVRVMEVAGDWNRLLSKMSGSRPHNGYILEASPIPKLPIETFRPVEKSEESFNVEIAHQSAEEFAVNSCFDIEGEEATITRADITRYPLVLMLDRVLDPGNLGAIIRSAHFLGADAIAVVDHGTSPFSPVTVKASAGAAESFPILLIKKEQNFVKVSQSNGWKFFAATSPDSTSLLPESRRKVGALSVESALKDHPCVLMLGNEGEGLRPQLARRADGIASVENTRGSALGVDSLNVSVAAALLMQDFLRSSKEEPKGASLAAGEAAEEAKEDEEALF